MKTIRRCANIATALALASVFVFATGCRQVQLQRNTVRQAWTLGDIHQQQVMNNLAMFVYDYQSLPSFAVPNATGSNITDAGSAAIAPGFGRSDGVFQFDVLGMSFGAAREAQESFTMTPINDPRKLELMRCAYQRAVSSCGYGEMSEHCPDCDSIFRKFYTGDTDGVIAEQSDGIVTSDCLSGPCWFQVGCKKDVPKDCPCIYVGHYCGIYVWVPPSGRNELAKLTLAILDYALNDPPTMRSKQVVYYIDEYGLPTTKNRSVGTVSAIINIDENNAGLIKAGSSTEAAKLEQVLRGRLQQASGRIDDLAQMNPEDPRVRDELAVLLEERAAIEGKLHFLNEQFRTGALRDKFYPPARSEQPGSLLLPFDLQQRTLSPGASQPRF